MRPNHHELMADPLPEHKPHLLEALNCDSELKSVEQKQLQQLRINHAAVFALDHTKLGVTDVVQHDINTGDGPSIL